MNKQELNQLQLEVDITEEDDEYATPAIRHEHHAFCVDKGQAPLRIDLFLTDRLAGVSRNRIQQAALAGSIFVNDRPVKSNYKVKPLDQVSIRMERPPYDLEIKPEDIPLDITYEDEYLLVVNKPAGMVVHPGHGNYHSTLLHALAFHLQGDPHYDPNDPRLGLVHRIDKDTSGLLLIAKTPDVRSHLAMQFFNHTTRREYKALVWGRIEEMGGTIKSNLGRDPKNRLLMSNFPYEGEIGKTAVTHYEVEERLGYVTLVKCRLETGRTHQIRAHMVKEGHPLFNDERYGGDKILRGNRFASYQKFVENCFKICPRQALHAESLGFYHPAKKKEMDFATPLPKDMNAIIEKWRKYVEAGELEPDKSILEL